MTTYPLPTLGCTVDATGIRAPTYPEILLSLEASYTSIFGSDAVLTADSQDGQLLAVFASAINDANAGTIAAFNSFSPAKAQGAGLSSNVKINGLERLIPSSSTVDLTLTGTVGSQITNGVAGDTEGGQWALPAVVVIGGGGTVTVTATSRTEGAVSAGAGTVTKILTPTRGWQAVTNVDAATPGSPVETDAQLRQRQAVSTALPALSVMASTIAAVGNIGGVTRFAAYENDSDAVDFNGLPAHSISFVVDGGDALEIATAIALKKTPGTGTYGTTAVTVIDEHGLANTIKFFRPTMVRMIAEIDLTALPGYVSTTGDASVQALADYVSSLPIGGDVYRNKCVGVADLVGDVRGLTFNLTNLKIAKHGDPLGTADVVISFNQGASLALSDITLVVT